MIMKKILLFLFLVNFSQTQSQTYVLIPDSNFVTWLQWQVPAAMSGNSLNITHPLVTTTTQTITINNFNISDLFGIQYFSSLTDLYCYSNLLTSLPSLPNSLK